MSEYSYKGNELVRVEDSTPATDPSPEVKPLPRVETVHEEPVFSLQRRSLYSEWSDSDIIHQLAILMMTKPERFQLLAEHMRNNTPYWQSEFQTSSEAQLLYEAEHRHIDGKQARRSLTSI